MGLPASDMFDLPEQGQKFSKKSLLILIAVTIGVYFVSIFNGFVWDDEFIIIKNPDTQNLSRVIGIFFSPDVVAPYYRPFNRITYLLDYQLFGMSPAGFHAVNILIHVCNVIMVYLIGCKFSSCHASSIIIAIVFAIHPINAEAVNFISARNTLLSLFFSLAALILFMNGNGKRMLFSFLSATMFFFGLLSKETSLMVVFLITFYSFYRSYSGKMTKLRENLCLMSIYLLFALLYLLMRYYSLSGGGFIGNGLFFNELDSRMVKNYFIIPYYMKIFVFPVDLTIFYSIPKVVVISDYKLVFGWMGIIFIIWLVLRWRNPAALFGLSWFMLNYIPISNIVPIPSMPMAERYMYIPFTGFCFIVGEYFGRYWSNTGGMKPARIVIVILLIGLTIVTVKRNLDWKSDITLFNSVITNNPASIEGHYNMGNAYREANTLDAARDEWMKTLELHPGHSGALTQLGTLEAIKGDYKEAERYYTAALRTDPRNAMAHYNISKILEIKGNRIAALEQYVLALKYLPVEYGEYKLDIINNINRLKENISPAER